MLINLADVGYVSFALVIYLVLDKFLRAYSQEKGKNLATKEDIGDITRIVENIKSGNELVALEIKNNHQLRQSEIDRAKNIKKEVFMEAIGALTRYLHAITKLSNLNIPMNSIDHSNASDSGLLAKVQIVGSEKTIFALNKVTNILGTKLLDLMLIRYSLETRKSDIQVLCTLRDQSLAEMNKITDAMTNLNFNNNYDQNKWNVLNGNNTFHTNNFNSNQEKINQLNAIQIREQLAFSQKCYASYYEINKYVPDAILAIREELDMPISTEFYLTTCAEQNEAGKNLLVDFFGKAEKLLGN